MAIAGIEEKTSGKDSQKIKIKKEEIKMKTEFDFGYDYAQYHDGENGFDQPIDIDGVLGESSSIPDGDYVAMTRTGITNPSARKYWEGFNNYFKEGKK